MYLQYIAGQFFLTLMFYFSFIFYLMFYFLFTEDFNVPEGGCNLFPDCENLTVAVREADFFRRNGGPIEGPSYPPQFGSALMTGKRFQGALFGLPMMPRTLISRTAVRLISVVFLVRRSSFVHNLCSCTEGSCEQMAKRYKEINSKL